MLELRGVEIVYGNTRAVHGISLRVGQGEIVTLIGANGAGKSTTLMAISGLAPPSRGEILFAGQPITGQAPDAIVKLGLCQVPEGRHIFPDLTVAENLDMGALAPPGPGGDRGGQGASLRAVSDPGATAPPGRRHPFRRRTTDAGHCPGPDGPAPDAAP